MAWGRAGSPEEAVLVYGLWGLGRVCTGQQLQKDQLKERHRGGNQLGEKERWHQLLGWVGGGGDWGGIPGSPSSS